MLKYKPGPVFWFGLLVLLLSLGLYRWLGLNEKIQPPDSGIPVTESDVPVPERVRCAVCGQEFDRAQAIGTITLDEKGEKKAFFDTPECRKQFVDNPYKYLKINIQVKFQPGVKAPMLQLNPQTPSAPTPEAPVPQVVDTPQEVPLEEVSPNREIPPAPENAPQPEASPRETPAPAAPSPEPEFTPPKVKTTPASKRPKAPEPVIPKEDQELLEELPLH